MELATIFSWLIVFSMILICIPIINIFGGLLCFVSSVGLLVTLIYERIKDKKEEDEDDFSQY